jgi:hypothetical protein
VPQDGRLLTISKSRWNTAKCDRLFRLPTYRSRLEGHLCTS